MKKIIAIILTLLYSCSNAFALSELYYFKNTNVNSLDSTVKNAYSGQNFNIQKTNPYYGTSNRDLSDYAIVILQQSGDSVFYYYKSSDNKKINKNILKAVKSAGITYEQSFNTNLLNIFDNLANQVINPASATRYTFEDPIQPSSTASSTYSKKDNSTLSGYVAQIQKGTKFGVYLQNPINTATASVGDKVIAVLTNDWVYNGYTVAPQGSLVYGALSLARHAQYGSRNGRVVIKFNQIVTPTGKTLNIGTEKVDFTVDNDGKLVSSVKNVATGAIIGALGGLLIGALSGGDHLGRSVAIGAGVGAGSAAIGSTVERGVDAEIPSFTELELELSETLRVTLTE